MPWREAEIEQRCHFDRFVQLQLGQPWLFVDTQFRQTGFAPGQQLAHQLFALWQAG